MTAFTGYAIGRIGHIMGGHIKGPHHWIHGLVSITIGLVSFNGPLGFYIIAFGIGLFVSDLKDFLNLRFYGIDNVEKKRFWGID